MAKKSSTGYTLTELLIVMGIAVALFVISGPRLSSLAGTYQLNGAVREMVADIQRGRLRAISERTQVRATFTTTGYEVCAQSPTDSSLYDQNCVTKDVGEKAVSIVTADANVTFDSRGFKTPTTKTIVTLSHSRGAPVRCT